MDRKVEPSRRLPLSDMQAQEIEQSPLRLPETLLPRHQAQSIVPGRGKLPGLHMRVNRRRLLLEPPSNRPISTQGGDEVSCVTFHTVGNNPIFADFQYPSHSKFKFFGKQVSQEHGYR